MRRCILPLIAGILLVAGCGGRVDIRERPAGGYSAVAFGEDSASCREAGERASAEARYFCEARGMRASLGAIASEPVEEGCRLDLPFWCTGSRR